MKRAISLLLALAAATGICTAAFAAQGDAQEADQGPPTTRAHLGQNGLNLLEGELILVTNAANPEIILPEALLTPGTEYTFQLYKSNAQSANTNPASADIIPVTEAMLGGGKLKLSGKSGTSGISSAKIDRKGSGPNATYQVVIDTRESWGTSLTDTEYRIQISGQDLNVAGAQLLTEGNVTFKVGYNQVDDALIDSFVEGDVVTISNEAPVITKEQFETLAKSNNYKAVQFESAEGLWAYEGRVSGMGDTNFTYSQEVIPAVVNQFEKQDFGFVTFGAGVNFPTNGELRINVSEYSTDYGTMYAYLYRNNKLTPISTTYDSDADELVFRTNYLGSFLITNRQITDTSMVEPSPSPGNEEGNGTQEPGEEPSINPDNPSTGGAGAINLAVVGGISGLFMAACLRRKKK